MQYQTKLAALTRTAVNTPFGVTEKFRMASGRVLIRELKCRWRAVGGVVVIDRKEERWQGVDDGRGGREV